MKRSSKPVAGMMVALLVYCTLSISTTSICTVAIAQQSVDQSVNESQERETLIRWLKQNNKFGPDHGIVTDMTAHIDDETKQGYNINVYFGKDLMKAGKYQAIHLWSGQFFHFPLSDQQAAKMDLKDSSVSTVTGKRQDKRANAPIFRLSEMKLNDVKDGAIAGDQMVTGTVNCQLLGEWQEGTSYALRQGYRTDVNVMRFHYFKEQPTREGVTIEFDFKPINESDSETYYGALPTFFDICTVSESGGELDIALLSNSVGTMLDVKE